MIEQPQIIAQRYTTIYNNDDNWNVDIRAQQQTTSYGYVDMKSLCRELGIEHPSQIRDLAHEGWCLEIKYIDNQGHEQEGEWEFAMDEDDFNYEGNEIDDYLGAKENWEELIQRIWK